MLKRIATICLEETGLRVMPLRLRVVQALDSLLPFMGAPRVRTALYRLGGVRIGHGSTLLGPLRLWGRAPLTIGARASISSPCAINLDAPVTIGDGVSIGNDVLIVTASHGVGPRECRGRGADAGGPVTIGDGAWIAANATIFPGVTIGAGAIVMGGSVVGQDVPPDTMVGGNPARPMRKLPVSDETSAEATPAKATPAAPVPAPTTVPTAAPGGAR